MWIYIPYARLPSAYKEVEYIQSTATSPWTTSSSWQYINTWVVVSKNIKLEIDMQFTVTTAQQRLFWWWYDQSETSWITFDAYINWSTQWARATKNWSWNWQTTSVSANTNRNKFILDNSKYVIYNSSGTSVYNGANDNTITNTDSWTIPLLARNHRSLWKICCHSSAKLYSCKIWDNNVLVRDFIPCYRKSDSVIGLYDLVNNQFYTNSWSWTFSKWSDVAMPELKNAYIGESWYTPYSKTFSYTWSDQSWTVPYTQSYRITAKWAWGKSAKWWLWSWIFELTAWDTFSIMVWANWWNWNWTKYWFGWSANWWGNAAWWWLSWVFTWSWAIAATDSARALVIGWGAGWNGAWTWWVWWGTTGWTGTWSYWTAWWGWTQTSHWSWWNAWANQFNWWNGSGTYWYWGWGWRWWGRWSIWDGSGDDDKWGWGWSWYVKSIATWTVLTQWWWANAWSNWEVIIEAVEV